MKRGPKKSKLSEYLFGFVVGLYFLNPIFMTSIPVFSLRSYSQYSSFATTRARGCIVQLAAQLSAQLAAQLAVELAVELFFFFDQAGSVWVGEARVQIFRLATAALRMRRLRMQNNLDSSLSQPSIKVALRKPTQEARAISRRRRQRLLAFINSSSASPLLHQMPPTPIFRSLAIRA
jgi:hypothetical protein